MAKLYFRYGTMGASKSANLLMINHNYKEKGVQTILWKPSEDTRNIGNIYSRVGISEICYPIEKDENLIEKLEKSLKENNNIGTIFIDEAQFLTKEQVKQLLDITVNNNIDVFCFGLRNSYLLNGFEGSKELLSLAHDIQEIKSKCDCGKKATTHLLKKNGEYIFNGTDTVIGDKEFASVCYQCYYNTKNDAIEDLNNKIAKLKKILPKCINFRSYKSNNKLFIVYSSDGNDQQANEMIEYCRQVFTENEINQMIKLVYCE